MTLKKSNSMAQIIALGESAVLNYLESHSLKDSDLAPLKKYIKMIDSKALSEQYKKTEQTMVESCVQDIKNNASSAPNFVLFKSLSHKKINPTDKTMIFDVLIQRFQSGSVEFNKMLTLVHQHESIELLKKMPEMIQKEYKFFAPFDRLDRPSHFKRFYAMQESGIYSTMITSYHEFQKSFALWDTCKNEIKQAFTYFDFDLVRILKNPPPSLIEPIKECLEHYIDHHVSRHKNEALPCFKDLQDVLKSFHMTASLEKLNEHQEKATQHQKDQGQDQKGQALHSCKNKSLKI